MFTCARFAYTCMRARIRNPAHRNFFFWRVSHPRACAQVYLEYFSSELEHLNMCVRWNSNTFVPEARACLRAMELEHAMEIEHVPGTFYRTHARTCLKCSSSIVCSSSIARTFHRTHARKHASTHVGTRSQVVIGEKTFFLLLCHNYFLLVLYSRTHACRHVHAHIEWFS
jgi:hypothetical protein